MKPVAFRKSHILLGLEDSINTNGIIQHSAKSLQSCPTLCDPIDGSPQGSPVPGILQARTLERVVISFSNAWKWKVKGKPLSRVRLLAIPWTAAYQAPPSIGFSRQEYWSGVPLPSPHTTLVKPIFIFINYCVTLGGRCIQTNFQWNRVLFLHFIRASFTSLFCRL